MSTSRPHIKRDNVIDLHYEYLPQVCYHGGTDPHRCHICQRHAYALEQEAEAKAKIAADQARRRAIAEQHAVDPEIEAHARFLQERWPDLDWPARAHAFLTTPSAKAEWERIKDELTAKPLF